MDIKDMKKSYLKEYLQKGGDIKNLSNEDKLMLIEYYQELITLKQKEKKKLLSKIKKN